MHVREKIKVQHQRYSTNKSICALYFDLSKSALNGRVDRSQLCSSWQRDQSASCNCIDMHCLCYWVWALGFIKFIKSRVVKWQLQIDSFPFPFTVVPWLTTPSPI